MTDHPFHRVWKNMMQRVYNSNNKCYDNYGGRGIVVCDRWLSFLNFREDMFSTYDPKLFLDRKDNDGPYSPDNCRWATRKVQNANRRNSSLWTENRRQSNNTSGFVGCFQDKRTGRWVVHSSASQRQRYIGTFDTIEEAAAAYRAFRQAAREKLNV